MRTLRYHKVKQFYKTGFKEVKTLSTRSRLPKPCLENCRKPKGPRCFNKDSALERAENAPCPYLGVSDHRKSNKRTETQTGNAEILEVHAFYCERDTPDMINQPQCCMNNKNYCGHKVLIRCEIVLRRQTFISLFLFRPFELEETS